MNITTRQLAEIFDSETAADIEVTGFSTDTRTIEKGNCFIALKGDNHDGHDHIEAAIAAGASCIIAAHHFKHPSFGNIIKVTNPLKALGKLANWSRKRANYKLIGITGSVGKTSTRQILAHVLARKFNVHQSPKNYNNKIGLPLTLLSAPDECEFLVAEMGTNYPGEISELSKMANPDIAILTNVRPAHLEGFGSVENIVKEKLSIAQGLKKEGRFIVTSELAPRIQRPATTFGLDPKADIHPQSFHTNGLTSEIELDGITLKLPLPGRGSILNTLAVWAVCKENGFTLKEFAQALKSLPPVSMRAEIIKIADSTIINDCYNANPASMENALDIGSDLSLKKNTRFVFICGDMAELGEHSKFYHNRLAEQICRNNVQLLITVGSQSAKAAKKAKTDSKNGLEIISFANAPQAAENMANLLKNGDIILIKGSRSNKLELVTDHVKQLFESKLEKEVN